MRLLALFPVVATAVNVLISNDDGWAELNIRQLYQALEDKGFSAIISAPAENQSGRGSLDAAPTTVDDDGCEFKSCPPGSPSTGHNASEPRFNYVNSYPVTSVKYGINTFSQQFFGGNPDIVVAGFNVGANLDIAVPISGTVGAATEAAKQGIPAIAFSGSAGEQISWETTPVPNYAKVYANLSAIVTEALVSGGKPYLPPNTWLNVNFPKSADDQCTDVNDFSFILTRITPAVPFVSGDDAEICENDKRLPTERSVVTGPGCFVSISVGEADTKFTAGADQQNAVVDKLEGILSCLPDYDCVDIIGDL